MFISNENLLIDVLVTGYESEKPKIKDILDSLQAELDVIDRKDLAVSFFIADTTEKSREDINLILKERCTARYYTVVESTIIALRPDYIKDILDKIEVQQLEPVLLEVYGIYINPNYRELLKIVK